MFQAIAILLYVCKQFQDIICSNSIYTIILDNKQEPYGHLTSASVFIDRFNMASVEKINGK